MLGDTRESFADIWEPYVVLLGQLTRENVFRAALGGGRTRGSQTATGAVTGSWEETGAASGGRMPDCP